MTPDEKRALVESTLIACLHQDFETARPNLAPTLSWVVPKSMAAVLGKVSDRDAFIDACATLKSVFPDGLTVSVDGSYCDGDTVLVEYNCKGRTASGKAYDNDYCAAFVLDGGQIQTIREYADTKHVAEVMFS